jgi:hypothetical protein
MPPNTHELLEECKSSAQALVAELEKFKSSTAANRAAADSFDKVGRALTTLLKEISPLVDLRFRRFQWIVVGWSALNTIFMISCLVLLLLRK